MNAKIFIYFVAKNVAVETGLRPVSTTAKRNDHFIKTLQHDENERHKNN